MKSNLLVYKFLVGIISVFLISSCEEISEGDEEFPQTNVYDTVYPSSYFPAWPGSYWVYDNGDSLVMRDEFQQFSFNDYPRVYDTVYLPRIQSGASLFNGTWVKEYGILTYNYDSYRDIPFRTILSEKEGDRYGKRYIYNGYSEYRYTTKADTTIIINGVSYPNTIIVLEYDEHLTEVEGYKPPDAVWHQRDFFSKNVGMIRRDMRNMNNYKCFLYPDSCTIQTMILIDYEVKSKN